MNPEILGPGKGHIPTFTMSSDARLLMSHLRTAKVGDEFTYASMSELLKRKVSGGFGPLQTALRRLLKDEDLVFGSIRGVGIKRLGDGEIVDEGATAMQRIRRASRRSFERVNKASFDKLTGEQQKKFTAHVSVMATISHMSTVKQVQQIENKIAQGTRELPLNETLRMFSKS